MTTRDNGNFQSYDQEESKLNSTINANSVAHTLTHEEMIKKVNSIRIMQELLKQLKLK